MEVQKISIDKIKPYEGNAKLHPREQVEQIKKSIEEFGNNDPIAIDEDGVIIEGHGRLLALKELGYKEAEVIVLEGMTEEQKNAYRLVHNKLTMNSDFDFDILEKELEKITLDMGALGFDDLAKDLEAEGQGQEIEQDEVPDVDMDAEPVAKLGDVWKLGNHRLICGDSTEQATLDRLLEGKAVDLVFTDPPYGMKKEIEGVLNDNQNLDELLEFNKRWIPLSFAALKENGSWYCWGIDQPLMDIYHDILKPKIKRNEITWRNYITWYKGVTRGQKSDLMRQYPTATEKCLFVMCGVQGFNNNKDHYNEKFEGIRAYMEQEAKRAGLTPKKLAEITGVQMYGHWFTKSQFAIITEDHYKKLQAYYGGEAFAMPYNDLRHLLGVETSEYKTLKAAVMENRAYFDNVHESMNDCWIYETSPFATGEAKKAMKEERELTGEHATPKPLALCARAIKTSSRAGEAVLDLFGGSGSTLIACEQLDRRCYMIELDPHYCDVIIKRWETLTGAKAELLSEE